jgi:transcriptional regulator with XRE-family HTH domain
VADLMDTYPEIARLFGANLRRARKRADLSQEEVGWLASLHRTEVGLVERGERLPRIDTLVKLAGGLEVRPEELLAGIAWRPGSVAMGKFSLVVESEDGEG